MSSHLHNPHDIRALIERLDKATPLERTYFEREILDAGPEALQLLIDKVMVDARHRHRSRTIGKAARMVVPLGVATGVLLGFASGSWSFGALNCLLCLFLAAAAAGVTKVHSSTSGLLASFDDVRAVGALADLLDSEEVDVRRDAAEGLTKLLPRISLSDAGLLNPGQRDKLNACLKPTQVYSLHHLIIAILKAWILIGDAAAIPSVRALAATPEDWAPFPMIRSLAGECLAALTARTEGDRLASVLLRPAPPPDAENLLRPAENASEAETSLLLRPMNPGC